MIRVAVVLGMLFGGAALAQSPEPVDDPFAEWDEEASDDWGDGWDAASGPTFTGFAELAAGGRWDDDLTLGRTTLAEARWRIESEWSGDAGTLAVKWDALYDDVVDGWIGEVRDLTAAFRVGDSVDVKLGRQVLTWGTGDLVFLNDLFPKDFVSFFAGRDDEYLKAPSDTLRITHYGEWFNTDVAITPRFEPDGYLTGERFSFFFPPAGAIVAPRPPLGPLVPSDGLGDSELAVRLFKTVSGREYAAYFYRGFFKQPTAFDASGRPTFAPMSAVGASLRQPLGAGLFNVEFAYYDSRDDRSGTDPLLPNSELRALAGYERELVTNLTLGLQYYIEWLQDHDELEATFPFPGFEPDELRQVVTTRLTWRAMRDKLNLSLFAFVSPNDEDVYLRPTLTWRYSDAFTIDAGASVFAGSRDRTFFGQLEDNSNVYVRLRFNY